MLWFCVVPLILGLSKACAPINNPVQLGFPTLTLPKILNNPEVPRNLQLTSDDYVQHEDDTVMPLQRDTVLPLSGEPIGLRAPIFNFFRPWANPKLVSTVNYKNTQEVLLTAELSPPMNWTYCEPICGVGDQAVDSENALENAGDDIKDAVRAACEKSLIACDDKSIVLEYQPESILVEDFGPYFDINGNRYRLSGKIVAYRINSTNPENASNFYKKVIDYLSARKGVHVMTDFSKF
ncbi:unnamed protein product [Caenorhabditis auriculariae]|uniref:Uncharacterized protein n=1 Tax=Caenorhabditis auriculariae TaxID=2777116 RepID=A0A8S1GR00_9PELO|nr:unnamed protein product [Caenorhabditis auriculariae]